MQSWRRAVCSIALLNVGLAGSFVTILLRSPLKLAFALVVVASLAIYGREITAILRARKRRALDCGIKYFLTAIALNVGQMLAHFFKPTLKPFTPPTSTAPKTA